MPNRILTIAGSDTLSGGGLQADLVTFSEYGNVGFTAITSIVTVVQEEFFIHPIEQRLFKEQLKTIQSLPKMDGIKIGLLPNVAMIKEVGGFLQKNQEAFVVCDPVLVFKETGTQVVENEAQAMIQHIFPFADIVTPNKEEARVLSEMCEIHTIDEMKAAAEKIHRLGAKSVVVKGGARLDGGLAVDVFYDGIDFLTLETKKLDTLNNNGAGCTFASAITSAKVNGMTVQEAIIDAKDFVYQGIQHGVVLTDTIGNVWQSARRVK